MIDLDELTAQCVQTLKSIHAKANDLTTQQLTRGVYTSWFLKHLDALAAGLELSVRHSKCSREWLYDVIFFEGVQEPLCIRRLWLAMEFEWDMASDSIFEDLQKLAYCKADLRVFVCQIRGSDPSGVKQRTLAEKCVRVVKETSGYELKDRYLICVSSGERPFVPCILQLPA